MAIQRGLAARLVLEGVGEHGEDDRLEDGHVLQRVHAVYARARAQTHPERQTRHGRARTQSLWLACSIPLTALHVQATQTQVQSLERAGLVRMCLVFECAHHVCARVCAAGTIRKREREEEVTLIKNSRTYHTHLQRIGLESGYK